ncbi:MAG: DUF3613 domain-containing protein [Panacagrimonas sp.]
MRNKPLIALLYGLPLLAAAAGTAPVGTETRDWTALQVEGKAGSDVPRPMPGEIAERVYQRYAESFSHPIPEKLSQDSFTTTGGGGK